MKTKREALLKIADALTVSPVVAINPGTFEFLDFNHDPTAPFIEEIDAEFEQKMYDADVKRFEEVKQKWPRHVLIERISSRESYRFMEDFVETLQDNDIKKQLYRVLDGRRPFANFKNRLADIDHDLLEAWYTYQAERSADWVKKEIEYQLS